jgi:hypothetical protein|tara:strand:- start:78 stop:1010 length:933 start_codon:yes stop_codon:yes gene_type:complete
MLGSALRGIIVSFFFTAFVPAVSAENLVPSPDCIKDLVENDQPIPIAECLTEIDSFEYREFELTLGGTGLTTTVEQADGAKLGITYHNDLTIYEPEATFWAIEVAQNTGGTGWFSSAQLVMKTPDNNVVVAVAIPFGDRCNDGDAEWLRIDLPIAYTAARATPFRLLNPLDDVNWRMARIRALALGKDGDKEHLLGEATAPLFKEWLPYDDLENSASSCMGHVIHAQRLTGENFSNGKKQRVDAVIVDVSYADQLIQSESEADRCFGTALKDSDFSDFVIQPEVDNNFILVGIDAWLEFRDSLAKICLKI